MAEDDQNNENGGQGADTDDLDIDALLGDDEGAGGAEDGTNEGGGEEASGGDEDDPWAAAMAEQLTEDPVDEPPEGFEDLAAGGDDQGGDDDPLGGGDTDFGMSDLMGGQGGDAQPAAMPNLDNEAPSGDGNAAVNLDMIMDIPVTIAMEIGRTQINIRNLLQLNQGSVVELDRFAGEPLDVMVNGTLIAHGEVVVVNEKFGIRLTDVISAQERIKKLK